MEWLLSRVCERSTGTRYPWFAKIILYFVPVQASSIWELAYARIILSLARCLANPIPYNAVSYTTEVNHSSDAHTTVHAASCLLEVGLKLQCKQQLMETLLDKCSTVSISWCLGYSRTIVHTLGLDWPQYCEDKTNIFGEVFCTPKFPWLICLIISLKQAIWCDLVQFEHCVLHMGTHGCILYAKWWSQRRQPI